MAAPLKFAIINNLAADRPTMLCFTVRSEFLAQCDVFNVRNVPYVTYERRVRKDGRWLWHPCETRFFDANKNKVMNEPPINVLRSCRDHWKTSFEHERANVIRLRREIASQHAIHYEARSGQCECEDCKLVRSHQ